LRDISVHSLPLLVGGAYYDQFQPAELLVMQTVEQ
jgi:hypothetical protein